MEKQWGKGTFWGMSSIYDPQWILNEEQKEIERNLVEVCRTVIRPNAVVSDKTYEFPRKSMDALASLNLLGLLVPRELGGLGQTHVGAAMVVETIARYGCPSTAMVYVMHLGAVATLLHRHHDNKTIQELLRRVDREKLIGTLIFSDPATGGHNWYPFSSKCKQYADGRLQMLRFGSWVTSAGFADFYVVEATSPRFDEDYMNLSSYLLYKDEVRSSAEQWSAMGMHGNQSGPVICEAVLTADRLVGDFGEFPLAAHEVIDPYFLILSSSCWNGVALGCIDIAKNHVSQKQHVDMGMRVADYPIIQDYFGEAVTETNASRMNLFGICRGMDDVTNNNDWSIYAKKAMPSPGRGAFHHWCFQVKIKAASNVCFVGDKMLFACGGAGYKTDLGLERLVRDGKAGWLMGASNEVLRQLVGKIALFGMGAVDFWCKIPNKRVLQTELRKLSSEQKRALADELLKEIQATEGSVPNQNGYQDSDFDNPFHTTEPDKAEAHTTPDGVEHRPVLSPDSYTALKLKTIRPVGEMVTEYSFALPHPTDHSGCLPGQYLKVRVGMNGSASCERCFSPVSATSSHGTITLLMKFNTAGLLSKCFRALQPGNTVEFKGPCGGFEYRPNSFKHLSLVVSGIGCTPAIQLVREVANDPRDQTSICLIYYADKASELTYGAELEKYGSNDPRIKLFFTVGEVDQDNDQWEGGVGYIDSEMLSAHLPVPAEDSHQIILCGGPSMVTNALRSLADLGYPSERVFVYGQLGAQQVRGIYGRFASLSAHTRGSGQDKG